MPSAHAADLFERANGRLYLSADFSLPRDLEPDDQIALAHAFAQELPADQRLPYTLAVHAGQDADGREHNPHAHLMVSERRNDGVERSREQWFRRANSAHQERGGAPKSRTFHGREWMEHVRERWAELTNATWNDVDVAIASITAATSARHRLRTRRAFRTWRCARGCSRSEPRSPGGRRDDR